MRLVTLKKNREFGLVYSRGKAFSTKNMVLIYLPRRFGGVRVGFSVSKKVGGSVVRNKVRRRLKECFREMPDPHGSAHLVFIARPPITEAAYCRLKKDMLYLLARAGVCEKKG